MMLLADDWKDYELIDTGNGEKLERWGKYILRRPDPQIIWPIRNENGLWKKADAHYHRSRSGGGSWEFKRKLPERWTISYHDLSFYIEPTGFKHTGLFPEQAVNWKWMIDKIRSASRNINVLNLLPIPEVRLLPVPMPMLRFAMLTPQKGWCSGQRKTLLYQGWRTGV